MLAVVQLCRWEWVGLSDRAFNVSFVFKATSHIASMTSLPVLEVSVVGETASDTDLGHGFAWASGIQVKVPLPRWDFVEASHAATGPRLFATCHKSTPTDPLILESEKQSRDESFLQPEVELPLSRHRPMSLENKCLCLFFLFSFFSS